jgi:hypothetical protein
MPLFEIFEFVLGPTHFVFGHWWVIMRASEGNYWTAENVGAPLLQRADRFSDRALGRESE